MRKAVFSMSLVSLIALGAWIFGCAGSDALDETHDRYQISISLVGGEGDAPHDLEVFSAADCDGDPATDDPEPGLAGISGTLTITSASDAPFVQIQHYQVQYIPQSSTLVGGGTDIPPDLAAGEVLEKTINVPSGSTVSAALDTIMTIDTKLSYVNQGGLVTFAQGVYVIRVTLYGEDENNGDFEETIDTVVRLMDIGNC